MHYYIENFAVVTDGVTAIIVSKCTTYTDNDIVEFPTREECAAYITEKNLTEEVSDETY